MSILQIELPDEQLQIIHEQARAQGYISDGEYLLAIWRETADQRVYMTDQSLTREQFEAEEQMLLRSLDEEGEDVDDAWWDKLHSDVLFQVAAKKQNNKADDS